MGSAPDSDKVGAGTPVAVTVKLPGMPWVNVVVFGLVMAGATGTGGAALTVWLTVPLLREDQSWHATVVRRNRVRTHGQG